MLESLRCTLNPTLTIFQLYDQDKLYTILNVGWTINSVLTFQEEEINDELQSLRENCVLESHLESTAKEVQVIGQDWG